MDSLHGSDQEPPIPWVSSHQHLGAWPYPFPPSRGLSWSILSWSIPGHEIRAKRVVCPQRRSRLVALCPIRCRVPTGQQATSVAFGRQLSVLTRLHGFGGT